MYLFFDLHKYKKYDQYIFRELPEPPNRDRSAQKSAEFMERKHP